MSTTATGLRSGELAIRSGVSADTVRHYERLGILPKAHRTPSGYRLYPVSSVERVQLARRALQLGFSLAELAEILQTRDNGGAPCRRVLALTETKLSLVEKQIEELQQTRAYMRQLVREWREKLKTTPRHERAMLLSSLVSKPGAPIRSDNLKRRKP